MKVVMTFDFSDDERELIVEYNRSRGEKGQPKLATRKILRDFVYAALGNQWLNTSDQLKAYPKNSDD